MLDISTQRSSTLPHPSLLKLLPVAKA